MVEPGTPPKTAERQETFMQLGDKLFAARNQDEDTIDNIAQEILDQTGCTGKGLTAVVNALQTGYEEYGLRDPQSRVSFAEWVRTKLFELNSSGGSPVKNKLGTRNEIALGWTLNQFFSHFDSKEEGIKELARLIL